MWNLLEVQNFLQRGKTHPTEGLQPPEASLVPPLAIEQLDNGTQAGSSLGSIHTGTEVKSCMHFIAIRHTHSDCRDGELAFWLKNISDQQQQQHYFLSSVITSSSVPDILFQTLRYRIRFNCL